MEFYVGFFNKFLIVFQQKQTRAPPEAQNQQKVLEGDIAKIEDKKLGKSRVRYFSRINQPKKKIIT